jgi:hypothetical protein
MTCFSRRHALCVAVALASGVGACGSVEPVFPHDTSNETGAADDGCDASDTFATAGGGTADTSGSTGGSEPAPDGCESTSGECMPGLESCPCTSGGACNAGLMCISDVCVQEECPIGLEGCPCTQGGGCDPDLTCVDDVCSA